MASIISVADIITKSFQLGRSVDCCIDPISREMMQQMRYPYGIQPAFMERVYSELNMYNSVLKIDNRTFPGTRNQLKYASEVMLVCHSFTGEAFIPVYEYLKTQGYQITLSNSIQDLIEKCKIAHAAVLTGIDNSLEEEFNQISQINMIPFKQNTNDSDNENAQTDTNGSTDSNTAKKSCFLV